MRYVLTEDKYGELRQLVRAGKTPQEIGEYFGLTPDAIRVHMRKLGLKNPRGNAMSR